MEGGISVGKNSIYKGTDIETKRPELRRAFMTGAMSSLHSLMTELSHHQQGRDRILHRHGYQRQSEPVEGRLRRPAEG